VVIDQKMSFDPISEGLLRNHERRPVSTAFLPQQQGTQ